MVDDADLVLVAYGISSRVCKSAVRRARTQGVKLGLIRLISAWPYPEMAFKNLPDSVKGLVSVEMSTTRISLTGQSRDTRQKMNQR